jgi:hypothetical protein
MAEKVNINLSNGQKKVQRKFKKETERKFLTKVFGSHLELFFNSAKIAYKVFIIVIFCLSTWDIWGCFILIKRRTAVIIYF